ncbi:hypothetical protein R3P38DRAFT_3352370 [Favolaschia claudopus]|uniref:Uncharacterized protein n=1 Tax=Favolaschia claudopus TaxID=2862362 RepID=A0AAW0C110_9AGAR
MDLGIVDAHSDPSHLFGGSVCPVGWNGADLFDDALYIDLAYHRRRRAPGSRGPDMAPITVAAARPRRPHRAVSSTGRETGFSKLVSNGRTLTYALSGAAFRGADPTVRSDTSGCMIASATSLVVNRQACGGSSTNRPAAASSSSCKVVRGPRFIPLKGSPRSGQKSTILASKPRSQPDKNVPWRPGWLGSRPDKIPQIVEVGSAEMGGRKSPSPPIVFNDANWDGNRQKW